MTKTTLFFDKDWNEVPIEKCTFAMTLETDEEGKVLSSQVFVKNLVSEGGPGSGFFGHAGRPGEVGGSAPSKGGGNGKEKGDGKDGKSATMYHATFEIVVGEIVKKGILAPREQRANLPLPVHYKTGMGKASNKVFMTNNHKDAMLYARMLNMRFDTQEFMRWPVTPVIFKISIPAGTKLKADLADMESLETKAWYTEHSIPPEWIKGYEIIQKDGSIKYVKLREEVEDFVEGDYYIPVLVVSGEEEPQENYQEGGPGSGFHGHAGRPGLRGGSSPKDGETVDKEKEGEKSPGSTSFTPDEQKHLSYVLDSFKKDGMEHSSILTSSGEVFIKGGESKDSIIFTDEEIEKIRGARFFVHNHPSGTSFSEYDVRFNLDFRMQVSVVTSEKYTYRFEILNPQELTQKSIDSFMHDYQNLYQRLYDEKYNPMFSIRTGSVIARELSDEEKHEIGSEILAMHTHEVLDTMVKRFPKQFRYSRSEK